MNKSGSFNINGVRIHVEDDDFVEPWRDHETVLMQHGFCRNAEFWSTWVPYFGRNYRIVRPHLRGHGFSSDPGPTYKLTLDDLIADLIGVLDTLKIDSVHYLTPTDDNHRQTERMKAHGIFDAVNEEVGKIIVADVNKDRMKQILDPDRAALGVLIDEG